MKCYRLSSKSAEANGLGSRDLLPGLPVRLFRRFAMPASSFPAGFAAPSPAPPVAADELGGASPVGVRRNVGGTETARPARSCCSCLQITQEHEEAQAYDYDCAPCFLEFCAMTPKVSILLRTISAAVRLVADVTCTADMTVPAELERYIHSTCLLHAQ